MGRKNLLCNHLSDFTRWYTRTAFSQNHWKRLLQRKTKSHWRSQAEHLPGAPRKTSRRSCSNRASPTPPAMAEADLNDENIGTFSIPEVAWFKFVFGVIFMAFGFVVLIMFFRSRKVFEIRARSAYLCTLLGASLLSYQGLLLDLDAIVLFDTPQRYLPHTLALYFVTFLITSCYVSRVIRLGVAYEPALRRTVPWLMSEKLLVTACLCIGIISLSIPLHSYFTITGTDSRRRYKDRQDEDLWWCSLSLQIVKCLLLPVVWIVDDIFRISRELAVIITLGIVQSVFSKLSEDHLLGRKVELWVNPPNIGFLSCTILFSLSVVDPMRRLIFHPLSGTSLVISRAMLGSVTRKERQTVSAADESVSESECDSNTGGPSDSHETRINWDYEMIASIPEMAETFKDFAHRALCQESVLFLEEVARFRCGDFTQSSPRIADQVTAFEAIARRFIVDGAVDEINISYAEKRAIIDLMEATKKSRDAVTELQRRRAFDTAYCDIRNMLESNILQGFTKTQEFQLVAQCTPRDLESSRHPCCFP